MSGKGDKYKSYGPGTTSAPGVKAETQGRIESTKEATGTTVIPTVGEKPVEVKYSRRTEAQITADDAARILGPLKDLYGRFPDGTSKRIALLNPLLSALVTKSDIGTFNISKLGAKLGIPATGGRRRQSGGGFIESIQAAKAIATMLAYKAGEGATLGTKAFVDYVTAEIIYPVFGTSEQVLRILIKLAEQLAIQTPVTLINGTLASVGFTANVLATIAKKFNAWGRQQTAILLSDGAAEAAAAVAVGDFKSIAITAGITLTVANTAGILPLSTLAAAILGGLKITVKNPVLRANVVAALYAWYLAQDQPSRNAINTKAAEYAQAAKSGAESAFAKAKEVAPYLLVAASAAGVGALGIAVAAPGAAAGTAEAAAAAAVQAVNAARLQIAGLNAFQTVLASLGAAGATAGLAVPAAVNAVPAADAAAPAAAILAEGAPAAAAADAGMGAFGAELEAAANAAMQAEDAVGMGAAAAAAVPAADAAMGAVGEGAAGTGGRRYRKTKKRAMRKRRITRRRPIFSY